MTEMNDSGESPGGCASRFNSWLAPQLELMPLANRRLLASVLLMLLVVSGCATGQSRSVSHANLFGDNYPSPLAAIGIPHLK